MNRSVDVNSIATDITLVQHNRLSPAKAVESEEVNLSLIPTEICNLELFPGQELLAPDDWRGDSIVGCR